MFFFFESFFVSFFVVFHGASPTCSFLGLKVHPVPPPPCPLCSSCLGRISCIGFTYCTPTSSQTLVTVLPQLAVSRLSGKDGRTGCKTTKHKEMKSIFYHRGSNYRTATLGATVWFSSKLYVSTSYTTVVVAASILLLLYM